MLVATTVQEVRELVAEARAQQRTVGLIPTMGFLHDGHLSLVDVARDAGGDFIVVSIFVNPRQFGPGEDFDRYPRDENRDRELLEHKGVDLLFMPPVEVMYPPGAATVVHVGGISAPLEGERRPGHFDGVATIVLKIFNIIRPDIAAFGRKDAQQCAVVAKLVADLDLPVKLAFGETVREHDGLAKSSRNSLLSPADRAIAPALHRALRAGEEAIRHGVDGVEGVEQLMTKIAMESQGLKIEYFAVVDPLTFERPVNFSRDLLLAGAIRIGRTRLIDNILVKRSERKS